MSYEKNKWEHPKKDDKNEKKTHEHTTKCHCTDKDKGEDEDEDERQS
jgi:hypothetical protein